MGTGGECVPVVGVLVLVLLLQNQRVAGLQRLNDCAVAIALHVQPREPLASLFGEEAAVVHW
eukprot:scaffold1562_cov323-Prasinococcus_capsulatus_cf.AAC.3